MTTPPGLYRLTARDTRVTPLDLIYADQVSAGNFTNANARLIAPPNSIFQIKHIYAEAIATGGQTVTSFFLSILDPTGIVGYPLRIYRNLTIPWQAYDAQEVDLELFPGYQLNCNCVFNLGAVTNTVRLAAHGRLIPRGNFSLGSVLQSAGGS